MKRIALILSTAIMISAFQPIAVMAETQDSDDNTEIFELVSSKTGVDDFMAAYGDKVQMNSDDCYNVTPEKMAEKYGFDVFKSDKDGESILLYNDEVYLLGEYFGGYGVTSFAVSDIDCDGFNELYFTYSWGSGCFRSEIGYFDTKDEKVKVFSTFCYPDGDMTLTSDDGVLSAWGTQIVPEDSPAEKAVEITYDEGRITPRIVSDTVWIYEKYDVNCDDLFNVLDVMTLKNWMMDESSVKSINLKAADINEDGAVNISDMCLIKYELVTPVVTD